MKKFVAAGIMAGILSVGTVAFVSPLITSDIPLALFKTYKISPMMLVMKQPNSNVHM